ncbi:DNRLRE domain-containing protein [Marinicrinis lubricantis]|uniref:DNRLRE domain-containing protein n=1 Tax=Marinicrinis lubricantis TaxID=2086470 RepID=A0ABW1IPD0_9BACL
MNRWLKMLGMFALILFFGMNLTSQSANANISWWSDGADTGQDARAIWMYFSNEYSNLYDTNAKITEQVAEMKEKQIDIIIASLNSADLSQLSDPTSEKAQRIQHLVNSASTYGIQVYIGHWEDMFTASDGQMSNDDHVDHVIHFNEQNGLSNQDIMGVVTDYEMHGTSRTSAMYEQWRLFHHQLKERIGTHNLKLIPTISEPDTMIASCRDAGCTSEWMTANGISGSGTYQGDVAYFTTYNGSTFADALMVMYYYNTPELIESKAADDIIEASSMVNPVPIITGISVGENSIDPSLLTKADVEEVVNRMELLKGNYAQGILGVMCWKWDDPDDTDDEYRGVMSHQVDVQEDAFVRSGVYSEGNYGNESLIEIKDAPNGTAGADYDRLGYMKFNLMSSESSSTPSSAKLYFYVDRDVTDGIVQSVPITIQGLQDDQWSEQTITWNSRPSSIDAVILGTVDITSAGWYSLDVTNYVLQQSDSVITLRFYDAQTKDRLVSIHSKESGNKHAFIRIH